MLASWTNYPANPHHPSLGGGFTLNFALILKPNYNKLKVNKKTTPIKVWFVVVVLYGQ